MDREMRDKQPLQHLLSVYAIKPIAFEANPYYLPKSATVNKHYGKPQHYYKPHGHHGENNNFVRGERVEKAEEE